MATTIDTEAEQRTRPADAESPTQFSKDDWRQVGTRMVQGMKDDHVTLNGAGVAFFAFLSIIPSLIALVTVYGLVADPSAVERRVDEVAGTLPSEARTLIVDQLESITSSAGGALTFGLIIGVAVALWSASTGMSYLIEAIGVAYDVEEQRGFVAKRAISLAFTLGALVFAALAVAVITALPAVLSSAGVSGGLRWLITIAAWPLVGLALMVALAVLYRHGPNREPEARWRWVSPGSVMAVVGWLAVSIGFQVYVANFGSYNQTYGSLGAVVIFLLWMWLSAVVILAGAELNVALERQTSARTIQLD